MQQVGYMTTKVQIYSAKNVRYVSKKKIRCRYCHSPYLSKILKFKPKCFYIDSFDFGEFKFFCATCSKIN